MGWGGEVIDLQGGTFSECIKLMLRLLQELFCVNLLVTYNKLTVSHMGLKGFTSTEYQNSTGILLQCNNLIGSPLPQNKTKTPG